ncbi:MAG TPA: hypothetical protein VKA44_09755 [Gemmatimonadota bacterium]|nr:hypothetical protein [Gemmatimonadota bacterium]
MKKSRILAWALVPMVAIACQGKTAQQSSESGQGAMQAQASGGQMASAAQTVDMSSKNQSGITGTATFTAAGSDSVQVQVSLNGIEGGKSYPTHIHHGSCATEGSVAQPLTSVDGQSDGTGTSTTTVAHSMFMADSSYFVQSHLPDGTPAACGDIPAMPHEGMSGGSDSSMTGGGDSM